MAIDAPTTEKRRYWLLTSPRTASNMFVKILNLDEQGVRPSHHGGYFFFPSVTARLPIYDKNPEDVTPEEHAEQKEATQISADALQDYLAAAEQENQAIVVKEHVFFLNAAEAEREYAHPEAKAPHTTAAIRGLDNPTRSDNNLTCLPDEFLKTWHPTFLIRHPAVQLPSLYRTAMREDMKLDGKGRARREPYPAETTMLWVRSLYDFYRAHFGENSNWPIVLDADDVMTQPQVVVKYAKMAGLDTSKLVFSWEKAGKEEMEKQSHTEKIMLSSVNASTGVNMDKVAGNVDIEKEAVKWREEFGEEGGRKLEKWVREAIPDYEYLRSKRLTLD
ncbi:hypothetical protein F5Y18DRAFT_381329 [Xylariaceae sp. FL1019]|nr:hypothetical protein F5Y18DRAFT_381329 [Xylariaceae sp. FL1019]